MESRDHATIRVLALRARDLAGATDVEPEARAIVERLDEPLRVAIVGRAKAGKSTLLNALVGERLAPTDASDCTRIVTWYRNGPGYAVRAHLVGGGSREVPFRRSDGALEVSLDGLAEADVERLEVHWPSRRLAEMTLIDTPGLAAATPGSSRRTIAALLGLDDATPGGGSAAPGVADAVVYLMRHLHARDADFLEAFLDRSLGPGSPVNAIAVLSRADEIGAGRLDAMASARRIADRYATDERIRTLVSVVVPLCGLLAETGRTLREDEAAWLREIASLERRMRDDLLLSADRFRGDANPLPPSARERLLGRFGMFGLRHALDLADARRWTTATDLSRELVETSGIDALERMLGERFAARSRALKARSVLSALGSVADRLVAAGVHGAAGLAAEVERVQAGMSELSVLHLLHLALSGSARLTEAERLEVERLASSAALAARLGVSGEGTAEALRAAAVAGVERWRTRSADPLADRRTAEAAEIAARAYEALYVAAGDDAPGGTG